MRRWHVIPIMIGLAAAAAAFTQIHGYGLFGFDSYPILLTSRIQNVHDFIGNFTQELMDGRFEGHFYRPLLNLSFALDTAIWKLNPFGFQLTNAMLFGAAVLVTWILARRLLGPGGVVGAWVAVLAFAFHPAHAEVFPVPSRRPELLAWVFGGGALALQLRYPSKRWLPAGLSFLAMLSKETAFLLPLWIAVAFLLIERDARRAVRITLPHAIAGALAIVLRLAVLHGLGGYGHTNMTIALLHGPKMIVAAVGLMLMPQPPLRADVVGVPLMMLSLVTAVLASAVLTRASPRLRLQDENNTILIGIVWMLMVGWTASLAGRMASWYLFLMVGGWALAMGGLAEIGWRCTRTGQPATRLAGISLLSLLAMLTVWPALYSPFVHRYREWDSAAVQSRIFLTRLDQTIQTAENGTVVPSPPIPRWAKVRPADVAVRGAALFSGMTLDAYFELAYPTRHILLARNVNERPASDEVLVVPTSLVPGFDGP